MSNWIRREAAEIRQHKTELTFLSFIVFFIILLRIPSLFEPYWYGDEGVYLTIGNALSKGLVLYRDIHDNKPPFIYLLAMGAGSQSMFRAYLLIWTIAGVLLFWKLQKKLLHWQKALPFLVLFGLLTSLPLIEGNIGNGENFFLPVTIAGMFCTWQILKGNPKHILSWSVLAGLSFSLGSLFKIPAAFDALAASIIIAWEALQTPTERKRLCLSLLLLALSFSLPWLVVSLIEWSQEAWPFFLKEVLLQNISYLSTWNRASSSILGLLSPDKLTGRFLAAIVFTIVALSLKRVLSLRVFFAVLWFIWALFGATLSGRPYAHYFLQVVPALVLLLGSLTGRTKRVEVLTAGICFALLAFVIIKWQPWAYHVIPYYQNFLQFALGKTTRQQYLAYFDPATLDIYELSDYLRQTTLPDEKIFLWGDWSQVYALSRRLPVGRYTTAYHISDFDPTQQETLRALLSASPRIIVLLTQEPRPFPGLSYLISHNYLRTESFKYATIYQRTTF